MIKRLITLSLLLLCHSVSAEDGYHLYIDADYSNNSASAQSIELGIRTAFDEVDWQLNGRSVKLLALDHHGSTPRSKANLERIVTDPNALAVYGGLHSPPLIANRDFINNEQVLTLVTWAAATPITRPKGEENWIFRLSVDDSKAGAFLVKNLHQAGLSKPYLLLENTGWGRANERTMAGALASRSLSVAGIDYFNWNITNNHARFLLEKIRLSNADSILFVGNSPEGAMISKAVVTLEKPLAMPIYSHWGITGGNFAEQIGSKDLSKLDIQFIQTTFNFFDSPSTILSERALKAAAQQLGAEASGEAIRASVGFIHAYDITRLLISAAKQSKLTGIAKEDKSLIKAGLESLASPVEGLIKTYQQPFSAYSTSNIDAHEALGEEDFAMAKFDIDGHIRLINRSD